MGSSHSNGEWDRVGKGCQNARIWEVWIDRQRWGDESKTGREITGRRPETERDAEQWRGRKGLDKKKLHEKDQLMGSRKNKQTGRQELCGTWG